MKILSERIRIWALVILISTGVGMTACSTGTSEGETNVEESDAKDRNPNEHNPNNTQPQPSTDTTDMDNAYEQTDGDKGVHDRDNNGTADQ